MAQSPGHIAKDWLVPVELALRSISVIAMMAIMLVVVADVVGRYVLASPLTWSYDFIGLYLMVGIFFPALADALTRHSHIAVDIFQPLLPTRLRHLSLLIGYAAGGLVMVLVGWGGWQRLYTAWIYDERIAAVVAFPTWVPYLLVTAGSAVMVLRCGLRVWGHGRGLLGLPVPLGLEPLPPNRDDPTSDHEVH